MLKSKAIQIFKTFSKDEYKKFEEFVISPYFNKNKAIGKLVSSLKKFYPEFNSEKMTEENVYQLVYGKNKYSYSAMRNLMSELIPLCEKFLIHNKLSNTLNERSGNSIELMEEYRDRKLDKLFNIRSKHFEEDLGKHFVPNNEYYRLAYELEILKYQYHLDRHSHSGLIWHGFVKKASLELCSIFQILYTTTDTLIQSSELLKGNANESIMLKFVQRLSLEKFVNDFDPRAGEEYFFINLYSKLILMTLNQHNDISEDYYYEIKAALINNLNLFSNQDIYDLLKSLRSYDITRMRMNNPVFIDELYEIDRLLIEKVTYDSIRIKWFIGEIFIEVVVLSAYKKDYQYAENFIGKYQDKLNPEAKEFETGWTKAFLNLEKGKVNEALELLTKIKPMNTLRKILIKNLYLRAYYELGFYEEAFSILDAYRHFVNKEEKFSGFQKDYYNSIHSVFSRLYKFRTNPQSYTGYDIKKLKEDVDKFYFLAGRNWFLDKVSEFEKLLK